MPIGRQNNIPRLVSLLIKKKFLQQEVSLLCLRRALLPDPVSDLEQIALIGKFFYFFLCFYLDIIKT